MHPIFDSTSYRWSEPDAEALHKLLSKTFKSTDKIEIRYLRSGDDLPDLNLNQSPARIWKEALENLAADNSLRLFCELLQQEGKPKQLMDHLKIVFALESITDLKVVDNTPLMDRKNLREKLTALINKDSNKRVIIVRGEKQSGKTYGKILFVKVAKANGGQPIYLSSPQTNTLRQVLNELFAPVGGFSRKRDMEEDTTINAWHKTICSTLLTATQSARKTLWIAMDNLGLTGKGVDETTKIEDEVKEFFDQLVIMMRNDAYKDYFRLMLIDYPEGDVPPNWEESIWQEDRTSQADIDITHIIEVIESHVRIKKLNEFKDKIKEKAAEILQTAEKKIEAAPANKPLSRIKAINEYLQEYLSGLK